MHALEPPSGYMPPPADSWNAPSGFQLTPHTPHSALHTPHSALQTPHTPNSGGASAGATSRSDGDGPSIYMYPTALRLGLADPSSGVPVTAPPPEIAYKNLSLLGELVNAEKPEVPSLDLLIRNFSQYFRNFSEYFRNSQSIFQKLQRILQKLTVNISETSANVSANISETPSQYFRFQKLQRILQKLQRML